MTETPKTNDVPGSDPDVFIKTAKRLVQVSYTSVTTEPMPPLDISEIYVTWFSKTLQNWKAVLGTTRPDGQYFEVTYNGDKKEAYLDSYVKLDNTKFVAWELELI